MSAEPIAILVIDSDNVRRGVLACNLPTTRYELAFAKTAERGLDLLSQQRPQVVIVGLDEQTPDLLQRVRLLPAGADCLLVLIHEQLVGDAAGLGEAETVGADVSLAFPFQIELLESAIEQHLSQIDRALSPPGDDATPRLAPGDSSSEPASGGLQWSAFRERVERRHQQLDQLDYYQLLEIRRNATGSEVKQAYFHRSMEIHPDLFMRLDDELLRWKIYEVYKRVSEAFRVLSQPDARNSYDQQLAAPSRAGALRFSDPERARPRSTTPPPGAETPAGRRYLRYAEQARQAGDLKSARMFLTLAVQCEPGNAALHARLEQLSSR